jgi:Ca2+-binding EF-hand superfamily protein
VAAAAAAMLSAPIGAAEHKQEAGMQKQAGGSEQKPVSAISFERLDTNEDGYLSRREVQQQSDLSEPRPGLIDHWSELDSNQDDQIDKSEFSAFEQMGQKQPAQQ